MPKSIFHVRPRDDGKGWAIDEYDGCGAWQHSVLKTPEGAVMNKQTAYGETKAECSAVAPVCNAIADAIDFGSLPMPDGKVRTHLSMRERAFDDLRFERDEYKTRAESAEKFRETIATLIAIYERQRVDEPEEGWPEGELSPRQVLLAVAETIGNECSICRRRHGREVQHAAE